MTALRFQTGGRHQTSLASLWRTRGIDGRSRVHGSDTCGTSRLPMLVGQVRHQEWKVVNGGGACGTLRVFMLVGQLKHQE